MSGPDYVTGTGQPIFGIHAKEECWGVWCVIHNPAPGPWLTWPTHWIAADPNLNVGINGVMTRICAHGYAHPCAEDVLYQGGTMPYHGCDGCPCGPEHIASAAAQPPPGGLLKIDVSEHAEREDGESKTQPSKVNPWSYPKRREGAEDGGDQVQQSGHAGDVPERPRDYAGYPAIAREEMTLEQRFLADQYEANIEETVARLVQHLIYMVIANGGEHPGREMVPTPWLVDMSYISETQAKSVIQGACWRLAETALVLMERNGYLGREYGVTLGEGFERDEH